MATLILLKSCLITFGLVLLSWPVQAFRQPPSRLHETGLLSNAQSLRTAANSRLPLEVIPTYYEIHIAPQIFDTQASDFLMAHGKVLISVTTIQSNASVITLNVDFDLIVIDRDAVQVREKRGKNLSIHSLIQDQSRTFLEIQLNSSLVNGHDYEVEIHYKAKLSQPSIDGEIAGIFAVEDVDPSTNTTSYLAVTHFQPAYARRAFPCFDEPNLKTRFELHIGRKGSYHSLSNMDVRAVHEGSDGWVWDEYNPTQIMSTYLVCFAVTKYISFDAPAEIYGKPVKIWTSRHLPGDGAKDVAARSSAKALQYFNNTFGIDYKFPKLDSIAIWPFFGGMENWGLVVYSAPGLQLGQQKSEMGRDFSSYLIANEVAHQWFGNLVTCKWWSDLWLNNGFAHYLSYHAKNVIAPELEPLERFSLDNNFIAMEIDRLPRTHPLKFEADRPVDSSLFSTIVHRKGAAVIRMMELIFGRELFYKGLRAYLDEMEYQGAEQDDLFRILQHHVAGTLPVDITVKDFLDTWTLQTGYPLVRVARAERSTLKISQANYYYGPHVNESQPIMTWNIPLSISTSSQPNASRQEWLRKGEMSNIVTGVDADQWILVNTNGAGYFRVLYDRSLVCSLWEQLNIDHTAFSTDTRAMLINDYFTFATAGIVEFDDAFEFTRYLGEEKNGAPWSAFQRHFDRFAQLARDNAFTKNVAAVNNLMAVYSNCSVKIKLRELQDTLKNTALILGYAVLRKHRVGQLLYDYECLQAISVQPIFLAPLQRYLSPRLNGLFETIGLREDANASGYSVILRSELLTLACPLGYDGCLTYGNEVFEQWKSSGVHSVPIPVYLRKLLYCGAVAGPNGNDAFNFFLEKYMTETDAAHRRELILALVCSKSRAQHKRLLALIAEDSQSGIESDDRWQVLIGMAIDTTGRNLAIEYIQNNLNGTLVTPLLYGAMIFELSRHVYQKYLIAKLEDHVRMNEDVLRDELSFIQASITRMRSNAEWMKSMGNRGFNWMEKHLHN